MATAGLPEISLPGSANFTSFKTSLNNYCAKKKMGFPKYSQEQTDLGFVGSVSFGSNRIKCKVPQDTIKDADSLAAYDALIQLGYLNGQDPEQNLLKRKGSDSAELDTVKQKQKKMTLLTPNAMLNDVCNKLKVPKKKRPKYYTVKERGGYNFLSTVTVGSASFTSLVLHKTSRDAEYAAAQLALSDLDKLIEQSYISGNKKDKPPLSKDQILKYFQKHGWSPSTMTESSMVDQQRYILIKNRIDELIKLADPNNETKNTVNGCSKSVVISKPDLPMKNRLQEYCAKNRLLLPFYEFQLNEAGMASGHKAIVTVKGVQYSGACSPSKKAAEASAAEVALTSLGLL